MNKEMLAILGSMAVRGCRVGKVRTEKPVPPGNLGLKDQKELLVVPGYRVMMEVMEVWGLKERKELKETKVLREDRSIHINDIILDVGDIGEQGEFGVLGDTGLPGSLGNNGSQGDKGSGGSLGPRGPSAGKDHLSQFLMMLYSNCYLLMMQHVLSL